MPATDGSGVSSVGLRFFPCTLMPCYSVESTDIPMRVARGYIDKVLRGGRKMERMSEWFCANCMRMVDILSRHGRCPYCDSNAVDVAFRWRRPGASESGQIEGVTSNLAAHS
jgi:hypothetical protein